jgi:hypothetical protein
MAFCQHRTICLSAHHTQSQLDLAQASNAHARLLHALLTSFEPFVIGKLPRIFPLYDTAGLLTLLVLNKQSSDLIHLLLVTLFHASDDARRVPELARFVNVVAALLAFFFRSFVRELRPFARCFGLLEGGMAWPASLGSSAVRRHCHGRGCGHREAVESYGRAKRPDLDTRVRNIFRWRASHDRVGLEVVFLHRRARIGHLEALRGVELWQHEIPARALGQPIVVTIFDSRAFGWAHSGPLELDPGHGQPRCPQLRRRREHFPSTPDKGLFKGGAQCEKSTCIFVMVSSRQKSLY